MNHEIEPFQKEKKMNHETVIKNLIALDIHFSCSALNIFWKLYWDEKINYWIDNVNSHL